MRIENTMTINLTDEEIEHVKCTLLPLNQLHKSLSYDNIVSLENIDTDETITTDKLPAMIEKLEAFTFDYSVWRKEE